MHTARILAIGDELLLGRTVDTNSSELARWATDHGLTVTGCAIVGDDEATLARHLATAIRDAAVVLITGGLGPTEDDNTRHALAAALADELVFDEAAWSQVGAWYQRNRPDIPVPDSNRRQALRPSRCRLLVNDRGTAPGLLLAEAGRLIACMPGVPHEMRAMRESLSEPLATALPGLVPLTVAEIHVAGVGESTVQDQCTGLIGSSRPTVGITAHERGHITLRVVDADPALVVARAGELGHRLAAWRIDHGDLAAELIARLAGRSQRVTVAESCTCGQVLARFGAVPGASAVLDGGWVTYADAAKRDRLGVDAGLLAAHGAVCEPVAIAMAQGARERVGADLALATTGIAGPGGGSEEKPVGLVWIAAATVDGVRTRRLHLPGSRARIQARAAAATLQLGLEAVPRQPGINLREG